MRSYVTAALFAVQFLTRIPVRADIRPDAALYKKTLILFPAAGWMLGGIMAMCWLLIPLQSPESALAMAGLLVCIETALTGGFHLDGLADTFDAFLSPPGSAERKLAIMKDSRIGVMGAVALVLSLLMKMLLLAEVLKSGQAGAIAVYPAVGRWVQVVMFAGSPYVRADGIGSQFSKAAVPGTAVAASLLLLPGLLLHSFCGAVLLVLLLLFWFRRTAHRHIGGITGDTVGAASVLSEITFLLGLILFA